jgi:hypothetical protein
MKNRTTPRLATVILIAAGALRALTLVDGQDYILRSPEGSNHWFLSANPQQAGSIYAFRDDVKLSASYLVDHERSGDLVRYSDGIAVTRVSGDASTSLVRAQDGTEGWVSSELIVLTPDAVQKAAIAAVARKRADQNAAVARKKAEQKAMIDAAVQRRKKAEQKAMIDAAVQRQAVEAERKKLQASCSVLFRSTADRKVSDLTVRESQQVRACDGLAMYHP